MPRALVHWQVGHDNFDSISVEAARGIQQADHSPMLCHIQNTVAIGHALGPIEAIGKYHDSIRRSAMLPVGQDEDSAFVGWTASTAANISILLGRRGARYEVALGTERH